VGTFASVRTALVALLVVASAVGLTLARPGHWPTLIGAGAGLLLPYLARAALVDRLDAAIKVHRIAGIAIIAALVLLRDPIKSAGALGLALSLGLLGAYISAYFWLMSDPRVESRRS
jgi:hypothetical protein